MNKEYQLGVLFSTDEKGLPQIQRIDDASTFAEVNNIEYIPQLSNDDEARGIIIEVIADNYIEKIFQDLQKGDKRLLSDLLTGEGLVPLNKLSDEDLINEFKEIV